MEKELVKVEKVIAKGKKYQVFIDINDEEYKFSENQIVTNRINNHTIHPTLAAYNKPEHKFFCYFLSQF